MPWCLELCVSLPLLHIRLLGEFSLVYGDTPVAGVNFARVQALLAYLVLHRHDVQSRQHIAFLFWPDSSEAQARANLRQRLHYLHQALPEADRFLQLTPKTMHWRSDAPFLCDVAEFERHLARASAATHPAELRVALATAVQWYQGDLLPSCYDDWLLPIREQLREQLLRALEQLIQLCEEQRGYAAAIEYGHALLRHDPLHEPTYRCLMRLHVLNGDRASALRIYHTCATILQRELGVTPSHDTQVAYERLLNLDGTPGLSEVARLPTASGVRLIGRQAEWRRLQTAWRSTARGSVHFVLVAGEAGIGKSRLAEEMFTWASQQGITTAYTRAYIATEGLAYAPVIEWLGADVFQKVLAHLDPVWLTEIARLRPELLVQHPELPRPEPLTERWQRQRLSEVLARTFLTESAPRLLVIDDLQWCDPETLEWLHYFLYYAHIGDAQHHQQARLMMIGTVRSEEVDGDHPLTALLLNLRRNDWLTEIVLGPLDAQETALLAAQVAAHELDATTADSLYHETEGNPLFIVETMRVKTGDEPTAPGHSVSYVGDASRSLLPAKVQAVIQLRLAQLSPSARKLVSLAAVIGRFFTFDVLAKASDDDEDVLVRGLDELWQRRIIREQGANAYDFSHDRIREVTYAEISPARQRLLHRRVAQTLEAIHIANLDKVSGQIATHYEKAGLSVHAIQYYQRAGELAQQLYANKEAINYWSRALNLLKTLPATPERMQQQVDVLLALGPILYVVKDNKAPNLVEVYNKAQILCRQLGDTPGLFIALRGVSVFHHTHGELQAAYELAEQCLALAQNLQDPGLLMAAHDMIGENLLYLGEFLQAKAHLEQAISYYDPQNHASLVQSFGGIDTSVSILGTLGMSLWLLGYVDRALECATELFVRSRQIANPFNRALASGWSAAIHGLRQEWAIALPRAEEDIAIATQWEMGVLLGVPRSCYGWLLAKQGRVAEGISLMQEGLITDDVLSPMFMAPLAETYGLVGQVDKGMALIDKALSLAQSTGMVYWNAELVRIQGELLTMQDARQQIVEAYYMHSIQLARQQNAKPFELRATVSLARLWQKQGRQTEARDWLREIYDWFTEGFATIDLQDAKVLLAELDTEVK